MWYHQKMDDDEITIVRAVQISFACPAQWDAWTTDGRYLYLRFRHGYGCARWEHGPDADQWSDDQLFGPVAASFEDDDPWAGCIELEEFCERAGITLAPDLEHVEYGEHFANMLRTVTEEANSDDLDMD